MYMLKNHSTGPYFTHAYNLTRFIVEAAVLFFAQKSKFEFLNIYR